MNAKIRIPNQRSEENEKKEMEEMKRKKRKVRNNILFTLSGVDTSTIDHHLF